VKFDVRSRERDVRPPYASTLGSPTIFNTDSVEFANAAFTGVLVL
jgi:hypothetical protein